MNNPASKITQTRTKAKNKSLSPVTMGTDAFRGAMVRKANSSVCGSRGESKKGTRWLEMGQYYYYYS